MLSNSDEDLKEIIFAPVAERVRERRDALLNIARFPRLGIEGWLKVEATRALLGSVTNILNKGPDLQFSDGLFVELKAATDCNPVWILGGLKYCTQPGYQRLACLFLGSGSNISACVGRLERDCKVVAYERFNVGTDEWIIGLIVPSAAAAVAFLALPDDPGSADAPGTGAVGRGAAGGSAIYDEERYGGERYLARIADLIILDSPGGVTWTELVTRLRPFADARGLWPWTVPYCRSHARFRAKQGTYRVEMNDNWVNFHLP